MDGIAHSGERAVPTAVSGVATIVDVFDAFIVDQWGVLHGGGAVFPGAVDALRRLKAAGKRIVILTNSGRRIEPNRQQMARRGLTPDSYSEIISSGEEAWRHLHDRIDPWYAGLGRRCVFLSHGDDAGFLVGLDLDAVDDVADADFILLTGSDAPDRSQADYEPILAAGAARGLPMICANPDRVFILDGATMFGAGALAARYEALGGEVRYQGKPHRAIYDTCLAALGDIDPGRVVAIGDSLEHDVGGARNAGIAAALVTTGIHRAELGIRGGRLPTRERMARLFADMGLWPDYVMMDFAWSQAATN